MTRPDQTSVYVAAPRGNKVLLETRLRALHVETDKLLGAVALLESLAPQWAAENRVTFLAFVIPMPFAMARDQARTLLREAGYIT